MKILFKGKEPADEKKTTYYVGICPRCLTTVLVSGKELGDVDADEDDVLHVDCPVCEDPLEEADDGSRLPTEIPVWLFKGNPEIAENLLYPMKMAAEKKAKEKKA